MKPKLTPVFKIAGIFALGLVLASAGCGRKPIGPPRKPAVTKSGNVPTLATNQTVDEFVSVFEDLPPNVGRDPFYPDSHRREPAAPLQIAQKAHPQPKSDLHLKGVLSGRQAIINNAILAVGEEEAVRVPDGVVKVHCLEIGLDYVVVQVQGEPQPKRLTLDQKPY